MDFKRTQIEGKPYSLGLNAEALRPKFGKRAKKELNMKAARIFTVAVLIVTSGLALRVARSQQTGIKRTELQRHDLSIPGREVIQVRADFPPGAVVPRHTHPGEEVVYVLEGTLQFQLESQTPVTLQAGEVLFVPAGTVHTAKNVSSGNSTVLSTYIVEKGKPLLTLVE
jgi:quercetin dioxygenase-like cupin family protein